AVAALPVGGLVAGAVAGVLIHRVGSGRLSVVTGVLGALSLALLGVAWSWATLAAAYLVLGMFDATMDAAMNAHGLGVQRRYGRSIIHGFHGWWSAGTMAAGAAGVAAAAVAMPVAVDLGLVGAGLAVATVAAARGLLPDREVDALADDAIAGQDVRLRTLPTVLRVLGPLALIGILGTIIQDAASTWSPIYLVGTLGLGAGVGASAFVLYTGSMTLGRLTNDRWVNRWGDATVVRVAGLAAAAGLAAVAAAAPLDAPLLAFGGFAIVGLGAAPMFPAMFAVAGSVPGIPTGHGVATVSWLARLGAVLAPAAFGIVADARGVAVAFLVPLAAALLLAALGPTLLRPSARMR
ncbi:MAG: MFS transporter, partial [Chloroflexi bacterium]|nr:MFS transporter [Chloroflexota bacterium]